MIKINKTRKTIYPGSHNDAITYGNVHFDIDTSVQTKKKRHISIILFTTGF